jgi:hypothetical protein
MPESKCEARLAVKDLNNAGFLKIIVKRPKPSTTQLQILSHKTQALDETSSDKGLIDPHYQMDASTMHALRGNGASDIG